MTRGCDSHRLATQKTPYTTPPPDIKCRVFLIASALVCRSARTPGARRRGWHRDRWSHEERTREDGGRSHLCATPPQYRSPPSIAPRDQRHHRRPATDILQVVRMDLQPLSSGGR